MKTKKVLKAILLMLLMLVLISGICFATETEGDEIIQQSAEVTDDNDLEDDENLLEEDDVLADNTNSNATTWEEDDIYLMKANENITISKNVSGNLYLIGKNITIESKAIYGNVYALAEEFNIKGGSEITGSVYVCASKINLEVITSDIYAVADEFLLAENYGVMRDFRLTARKANILGCVTRNAYITSEELSFGENSLVFGKLKYSAPNEVEIPELLKENCSEEIEYTKLKEGEISAESVVNYILDLCANLVLVFVIFGLCYIFRIKAVNPYENKNVAIQMLKELGIGLITLPVLMSTTILLMITGVGIPVAGLISILFILSILLYFAVVAISIANVLAKKLNKVASLLLSTLILWILMNLPVVGMGLGFLIYFIGLGIMSSHIIKIVKDNIKKNEETEKVEEIRETEEVQEKSQETETTNNLEEDKKEEEQKNEELSEQKEEPKDEEEQKNEELSEQKEEPKDEEDKE